MSRSRIARCGLFALVLVPLALFTWGLVRFAQELEAWEQELRQASAPATSSTWR